MKNQIVFSLEQNKLYLLDDAGNLQVFDLGTGLSISQFNGELSINPLVPFSADEVVRRLRLTPDRAQLNVSFDGNAGILSIVLTPLFPSTTSAIAGGGKMKVGSMDLTLSRNTLSAVAVNLGTSEQAGSPADSNETKLEWYLLDLNAFALNVLVEGGDLVLHTLGNSTGDVM